MNEFTILYVFNIGVTVYTCWNIGMMQAKLDNILNKLNKEEN